MELCRIGIPMVANSHLNLNQDPYTTSSRSTSKSTFMSVSTSMSTSMYYSSMSTSMFTPHTRPCSVADPGCLSRIPDPTFFHHRSELSPSRIRIKEFKYFNPKKWFLSSKKYDPGYSSRIWMLTFTHPGSRIQGSKSTGSQIRIRTTGSMSMSGPHPRQHHHHQHKHPHVHFRGLAR
jgi:hypothetical protein